MYIYIKTYPFRDATEGGRCEGGGCPFNINKPKIYLNKVTTLNKIQGKHKGAVLKKFMNTQVNMTQFGFGEFSPENIRTSRFKTVMVN